jgi:polyisoprenoid-binding protein YceI
VVPEESLLTVLVFRGGALAKAGHNHVIASHFLNGVAYVPEDLTRASFEVHVPVLSFSIDEPQLRALEGSDFTAQVPDSAREGTKKNMLSEPMLDGLRYPEIVLRAQGMERNGDGLLAQVSVTVRDQTRTLAVPLRYELTAGNALQVQGELSLKQTDLGLTPFSLFGGALRVEDEMRVKFFVVARGE